MCVCVCTYIYMFLPSDSISPHHNKGFPGGSVVKNLPANAGDLGDMGSIPGLGRSPGGGHGDPLQYSCLEIPHGQRSLVGYSPWGHKESDMTEQLSKNTSTPQ